MQYYKINGFMKHTEKDVYNEGCQPDTSNMYYIDHLVQKSTVQEIIEFIKAFTGTNDDDLLLNSCEQLGRIDAQVTENEQGERANDRELEAWKRGEIDLYLATYTAHVTLCTEIDVDLVEK